MAPSRGRVLDGLLAGGLVVTTFFAARPRAHFLVRLAAGAYVSATAARLTWWGRDRERHAGGLMTNSTLVSIVAHEIRAPLAAINGAVALLEEHDTTLDGARRRELLGVALDATRQLSRLVDDLLLISRIAGGRLRVDRDAVDVVSVVHEAVTAEFSHRISVVEQTRLRAALADAMRVRQVVTNLVRNAVNNSAESSIVVVAITGGLDHVRVTIYNEGRGIPPEEQSRLFLPFVSMNERRIDSTGLGLYIAKELVEAMGGRIGFDTQPGRDVAFWFTLPTEAAGDSCTHDDADADGAA